MVSIASDISMSVGATSSSARRPSVSIVHGFESPYCGPLYAEGFDRQAAQCNLDQWERAARSRLLGKLSSAGVDPSGFRLVFQQARPMRAIQRVIRGVSLNCWSWARRIARC